MTSLAHPDFEALSAYVDGEAPEWALHVAACAQCRATAEQIRQVAAAIGAPVDSPPAPDQERAVSAALDGALGRPSPASVRDQLAARRRPSRSWALPAVAAVIIGVLGFSGLILSSSRSPDETTTLAGPGLQSDKADTRAESGVAALAPAVPVADLGDVADVATLRARTPFGGQALARTDSPETPPSTQPSATNTGNTPFAGSAGASVQPPTTTLNQGAAAPNVGTLPCEEQARRRDSALGPVLYAATARQGQVQAFVLGFGPVPGRGGFTVTLLLLAQDGCAELLRTTVP